MSFKDKDWIFPKPATEYKQHFWINQINYSF